jgi:hypothetical protein
MDHFNATVQNGALVSTRRGLQVTKTKHQGTRFVNSFAAPTLPKTTASNAQDAPSVINFDRPLERRFKFVNTPKDGKKTKGKSKQKGTSADGKAKGDDESRRQGKLITRQHGARTFTPQEMAEMRMRHRAGLPPLSFWGPKPWATYNDHRPAPFDVGEKSNLLISLYFTVVPTKMYPLGELLEYNPLRTYTFFERVHRDLVTMHCVVMSASLIESVRKGERCSKEMSFFISQVCNMVNGKLQDRTQKIEPALLECIVAMAICGVSTTWGRAVFRNGLTDVRNRHSSADMTTGTSTWPD